MKLVKQLFKFILMLLFIASISQCSSSKQPEEQNRLILQENVSFELGEVYFQRWSTGFKQGGSRIHVYISVVSNINNVTFDSLYFRGLKGKVETGKMGYFAKLKADENQKKDLIMSGNSSDEYGNQLPVQKSKYPFSLDVNECVLSFIIEDTLQFYKISKVLEKEPLGYPKAPSNKQ